MKSTYLTQAQFRDAICKGLGRAILHLKQHAAEPYLQEVIYACTNNTAYDPQCEGDRSKFLIKAAALTGRLASVRAAILNSLSTSVESRSTSQLFGLAWTFAKKGDDQARQAIYEKFDRNDAAAPFVGASAIIELDGIEGLLHAARKVGQGILQGGCKRDDYMMVNAYGLVDEKAARAALASAAQSDPAIQTYLDAVESDERLSRARVRSDHRKRRSFADLMAEANASENGVPSIPWGSWARTATAEDLRLLALEIQREKRAVYLLRYLLAFTLGKRQFPLGPERLIELTSSDNAHVAHRAFRALRYVTHAKVRRFFFDLLALGKHVDNVLSLLTKNFQSGDEQIINEWLDAHGNLSVDDLHGVGHDLLGVADENEVCDFGYAMRWIYEKTPCSLCRHHSVKVMAHRSGISDELLQECRHDCLDETRKKAIQALRRRRFEGS